jgi:hypothetical protein
MDNRSTEQIQKEYVDSVQYLTSKEQSKAFALSNDLYEADNKIDEAIKSKNADAIEDAQEDRQFIISDLTKVISEAKNRAKKPKVYDGVFDEMHNS